MIDPAKSPEKWEKTPLPLSHRIPFLFWLLLSGVSFSNPIPAGPASLCQYPPELVKRRTHFPPSSSLSHSLPKPLLSCTVSPSHTVWAPCPPASPLWLVVKTARTYGDLAALILIISHFTLTQLFSAVTSVSRFIDEEGETRKG